MSNYLVTLLVTLTIITSCNNAPNNTDTAENISPDTEKANRIETSIFCFSNFTQRDTISLNFNLEGFRVMGELQYNFFEKDKNAGTINGEMKGDTLFAEYTFMSEGMNSVREVAFLKKGTDLVEGYGEMEEKNGRMAFKNKSALNFESKRTLLKVDCPDK